MDGAALERLDRVVDEARFVERVGVDADLHIHLVGDSERRAQHGRRGTPVLVTFHADSAGFDLFDQGRFAMSVSLAENAHIDRPAFERAQHHS